MVALATEDDLAVTQISGRRITDGAFQTYPRPARRKLTTRILASTTTRSRP
jgi:hypothetical protein